MFPLKAADEEVDHMFNLGVTSSGRQPWIGLKDLGRKVFASRRDALFHERWLLFSYAEIGRLVFVPRSDVKWSLWQAGQ